MLAVVCWVLETVTFTTEEKLRCETLKYWTWAFRLPLFSTLLRIFFFRVQLFMRLAPNDGEALMIRN